MKEFFTSNISIWEIIAYFQWYISNSRKLYRWQVFCIQMFFWYSVILFLRHFLLSYLLRFSCIVALFYRARNKDLKVGGQVTTHFQIWPVTLVMWPVTNLWQKEHPNFDVWGHWKEHQSRQMLDMYQQQHRWLTLCWI